MATRLDWDTLVAERRRRQFRPTDGLARSAEDLSRWVDQAGFCLLLPHEGVSLPNVAENAEGRFRSWRDTLIVQRRAYYGRPFRRRAGFVSLRLFPALYALSPTAEHDGDRFELYRHRFLAADANRIAGIVHAKGPLPTRDLRRESGMAGQGHQARFRRAVIQAEARFLIAKSRIGRIDEAGYTVIWDALPRYLPQAIEQAAELSIEEAARQALGAYVRLAGMTTVAEVSRLFALNPAFVDYALEQGITEPDVRVLEVDGVKRLVDSSWLLEP